MRFKKKSFCVENLSINLRTFAPIAIAHLYCARYLLGTRVPRHFQARAPSRKLNKRKAPAKRSQHANANISQHGGQTHATCWAQQCCDMLRWHVAIVWPGLKADDLCVNLVSQYFCWMLGESHFFFWQITSFSDSFHYTKKQKKSVRGKF